jgi:CO/xanthine dehydrogenase FAD-binding subunit
MSRFTYQKPRDVSEALQFLVEAGGRGRLIAGGTDLVLQLKEHQREVDLLVDISGLKELKQIEERDGWIRIGAGVTHAEVEKNRLIQREARALAEGCAQVGSPQIRNMGTLVGNVISAQPAGDGAIPLTALEAEIRVQSQFGERWVTMEQAYRGVGLSTIDSAKEVATEVRFRRLEGRGRSGFFRLARRKALALPILNGAVALLQNLSSNRIDKARIALGPAAERPFRPRKTEALLESGEISSELILEAARIASEETSPRTSVLRGGDFYRREMIRLFLARTTQRLLSDG